jgi:TNF receptor-associated protein 1
MLARHFSRNFKSSSVIRTFQLSSNVQLTSRPSRGSTTFHRWQTTQPKVVGNKQQKTFKAETSRLLDIVAKSLYSDKEATVRELTSNASDALEKLRYLQITDSELQVDPTEHVLQITVTTDKEANTLTIADSGIGMTVEELEENLGTIAHSGTRAFVEKLENASAKENLIGQFGVGFFSALAIADKVDVYTKSAKQESKGYLFSTDGKGTYEVQEAEDVPVGTRLVLHLKPDCASFADKANIQTLLKKYSNFISFPIVLDGERTNTIGAIWTKSPSEITDDEHNAFYQFISHSSFGEPQMKLFYKTDSPLMINALLVCIPFCI